LKTQFTDPAAVWAISELAEEAEMTAEELDRRQRTRERAHAIWVERGCPEGRDVKFWLEAEGDPKNSAPTSDVTLRQIG
jgi:hypothetical protein